MVRTHLDDISKALAEASRIREQQLHVHLRIPQSQNISASKDTFYAFNGVLEVDCDTGFLISYDSLAIVSDYALFLYNQNS